MPSLNVPPAGKDKNRARKDRFNPQLGHRIVEV